MSQFKDITGQTFGKLTALKRIDCIPSVGAIWLFACQCGTQKALPLRSILNGVSSCGCARRKVTPSGGTPAINMLYQSYKSAATKRSLNFDLDMAIFIKLTSSNCHYSNHPPTKIIITKSGGCAYIWNGIDRIDSDKGYTVDNCVPCCAICNRAKSDMTYDEFIKWITTINHNFKGVIE